MLLAADHVRAARRVSEQLHEPFVRVLIQDGGPPRRVRLPLPLPQPGHMRRLERLDQRGFFPLGRAGRLDAAPRPFPDDRPDGLAVQHAFGGIPQRVGFDLVDLFPQDDALALAGLLRVGVDARVPEPSRPASGRFSLPRDPVMPLPDTHALDSAFPLGPQRLHPPVIRAFRSGQVQVPARIRAQQHAVLDRRFLEPAPVRQVTRQPVHVADDHHVDLVPLDRLDQLDEIIPRDLLERRIPVVFEPGHHPPAAPFRVLVGVGELGGHRLGLVVGLAQPRV